MNFLKNDSLALVMATASLSQDASTLNRLAGTRRPAATPTEKSSTGLRLPAGADFGQVISVNVDAHGHIWAFQRRDAADSRVRSVRQSVESSAMGCLPRRTGWISIAKVISG